MNKFDVDDYIVLELFQDDKVFANAIKTNAGVRLLIENAKEVGYHVLERWKWKTGSRNRWGVIRVEDSQSKELWAFEWDIGSTRMPSHSFRLSSPHGQGLIAALTHIRTVVRAEMFRAVAQNDRKMWV